MQKKIFVILYFLLIGIPFSFFDKGIIVAQSSQKDITYLFYEIIKQRHSGNYAEAIDLCNHALLVAPDNSDILFELFQIHSECNNFNEAFYSLKSAFNKNPNNKYYKELLSLYFEGTNSFDEAIVLLLELIEKDPYNEEYIHRLMNLYYQTKNYKEAYKQLEKIEKIIGKDSDLGYKRVLLLFELNHKKVIPELKKLINNYPDDTRFWTLLGNEYTYYKNYKKANEALLYAINNTPKNEFTAHAINFLTLNYHVQQDTSKIDSLIYSSLKDKEISVNQKLNLLELLKYNKESSSKKIDKAFEILVEQHNENDNLLTTYAEYLLSEKKDTCNAITHFYKSLETNPHQAEVWTQLIFLNPKNQERILCEAIKYNPKESYFQYINAVLLIDKGEIKEALNAINIAIATNHVESAFSTYYGIKGSLLHELGDADAAFMAFEEAIRKDPSNHSVLNNYAYLLSLEDKDLQKAEEMICNAIKLMPSNATYLDTYAWILFKREQYTLALFYIEKAISKEDGQHSEIYDHYGDILQKKGDTKKALEAWKKAIELGENSQIIKDKIYKYTNENKD